MKHRSSCESFLERFPFNPIIGIITLVAANLPLLNPRLPELSYLQNSEKFLITLLKMQPHYSQSKCGLIQRRILINLSLRSTSPRAL